MELNWLNSKGYLNTPRTLEIKPQKDEADAKVTSRTMFNTFKEILQNIFKECYKKSWGGKSQFREVEAINTRTSETEQKSRAVHRERLLENCRRLPQIFD